MLCLPLHYLTVLARREAMSSVCGVCSFGFGFCGLLSPDSLKQRQDAQYGSLYVTQKNEINSTLVTQMDSNKIKMFIQVIKSQLNHYTFNASQNEFLSPEGLNNDSAKENEER